MNREQFFAKMAALDEEQVKKSLWNLYWRGKAAVRERIEAELEPDRARREERAAREPVDPERILVEVREFVALARSGAYMGGDRRVSPKERTRWRFTFQRLAADAQQALQAEDPGPAAAALEALIDLACDLRGYEYFRSEDPVEAARFVVSDAVALLWGRTAEHSGFPVFAKQAALYLIRWESPYGWTRSGFGRVAEKETSLASVLAPMLRIPDTWIGFADYYLEALDQVAGEDTAKKDEYWQPKGWAQKERGRNLAEWHSMLIEKLLDYEAGDRLDRLSRHRALGGPELTFLQARLAQRRGDVKRARSLMRESLEESPGHRGFLEFAQEIGAPLPSRARKAARRRG